MPSFVIEFNPLPIEIVKIYDADDAMRAKHFSAYEGRFMNADVLNAPRVRGAS